MRYRGKIYQFFALLLIAPAIIGSLGASVSAATPELDITATIVDAATIKVTGIKLKQSDVSDEGTDAAKAIGYSQLNTYLGSQMLGDYTRSDITSGDRVFKYKNNSCESQIKHQEGEWKFTVLKVTASPYGCMEIFKSSYDPVVNLSNTSAESIWFKWIAENAMVRVDGRDGTFMNDGVRTNIYTKVTEAGKDGQDYVETSSDSRGKYYRLDGDGDPILIDNKEFKDVGIRDVAAKSKPPVEAGGDLTGTSRNSCESEGTTLSWIICPLLTLADKTVSGLDSAINSLLTIPDGYLTDGNMETTWKRLRTIAYVILIPIMLVMVIGTALGFDFISAYTAKRALPRLVIAAIFIAVSWELTKFLVVLSNDIGSSLAGLISHSFGGYNNITLASIFKPDGLDSGSLFVGMVVGGTALVTFTSIGIIASYALISVVALLIGFVVLAFRQMLIIALMLLAPLAILAWIFPGNDKFWKLWWESFSKLLLLYPLIALLLAAGKSFAVIVSDIDSGTAGTFIKLTAYIGPYFLIPAMFKLAGGTFATISGMANDRGRGLFDRQRKKRAETRAHLKEKASMGHRFNPNRAGLTGALARKLNTPTGWMADPYNNARIKMNTQGGRSLMAGLTQKGAAQSQDLAKWMSQAGLNQEALTAIMQNVQRNHGHLNIKELNGVADNWARNGNAQEKAGAAQLMQSAQFLNDVANTEEFSRANIGYAAGLAKASQGFLNNTNMRDALGNEILDENNNKVPYIGEAADYSNFLNTVAPGLGDTFKTQAGLALGQSGGLGKVGYSEQAVLNSETGKIEYVAGGVAGRATQVMREGVRTFSGGKAGAIKQTFFEPAEEGALSAVQEILYADTSGGEVTIDDSIDKAKVDANKQRALIDNLVLAAYGYDTPAETAAVLRTQIDKLSNDPSVSQELRDHLERKKNLADRSNLTPAQLAALEAQERSGQPPADHPDAR